MATKTNCKKRIKKPVKTEKLHIAITGITERGHQICELVCQDPETRAKRIETRKKIAEILKEKKEIRAYTTGRMIRGSRTAEMSSGEKIMVFSGEFHEIRPDS